MIDLIGLSLQFGGRYLFKDINLRINSGERYALTGANGTGKSSLLKILCGELIPEAGRVSFRKNTAVGYLPQEHIGHKGKKLFDEAFTALSDIRLMQGKEKELTSALEDVTLTEDERLDIISELGEVHHRLEELESYSAESRVEKVLKGLGFSEEDFERLTDEFSGGWQMRIALAKLLIAQKDILLLDEPTNHLDMDSLRWLIGYLRAFKGSLLVVSHDRYFINAVTNKTLEIFLGKFNVFNGTYDKFLQYKEERDTQAENQYILQQKKIKEIQKFVERFRYKASKAKQVQSRVKMLEKMDNVELPEFKDDIAIKFPSAPNSSRVMVRLEDLSKAYGSKVIFDKLNFSVERGDKIALVGPNGAGKSTLSKIICEETEFQGGKKIMGTGVAIGYYAQDVTDSLDPDLEIIEAVDEYAETMTVGQLRSFLGAFLFEGDDVFKQITVLSGGEKSRVALARMLLQKSNLLILDEPTNHLDISSKAVLSKAISDFSGSVILVSHDIDFMKPIVNKVVEIRPGSFTVYDGGIDYYLEKIDGAVIESPGDYSPSSTEDKSNRKEQKRLEAERRQKRYKQTKDIVDEIKKLEKNIATHEEKIKEYEKILADENTYKDLQYSKEATLAYQELKEQLQKVFARWEHLQLRLEEIEADL